MAILTMMRHRFYKNDGTVNAGGKVYTYVAGTTTPTETYTDSGAGTPNANPIILDSKGEADIWVIGQIKVNVLESDNTQVTGWPVDNIGSGVSNNDATSRWAGTATGSANALSISPSPAISAYAVGQSFIFKASASANTGATTISISGLSAIAVQSNGAACAGGEILENMFYIGVLDTLTTCQITKIGYPTFNNVSMTGTTQVAALTASGLATLNGNVVMGNATTNTVTVNGYMGVGVAPNASYAFYIGSANRIGASQSGLVSIPVATSAATTNVQAVYAAPATAAAAFTTANAYAFIAGNATKGSGSTITNLYGLYINDQTQGTNNYGITSAVSSGANKWNIYASGTADNVLAGNVRIGSTVAPTVALDVTGAISATTNILSSGATSGIGYTTGAGGTVTQATNRTTGVTLNKVSGAITLVSAAGSTSWQSFTVTNSAVAATDTVVVNQKSGTDLNMIHVTAVAAGNFRISFATTGGTTTEQPVFNFNVIKGVAA